MTLDPNVKKIDELKNAWRVSQLKFKALFEHPDSKSITGYFKIFQKNQEAFYPSFVTSGKKVPVVVKTDTPKKYIHGREYLVQCVLASLEEQKNANNPYLLSLEIGSPKIINKISAPLKGKDNTNSKKEFINNWFYKKGQSPGDAATIASQLELNQLELYTQTQRFFFELLQNADDMPIEGKSVNVQLELLKDHFLFLHDGKIFDEKDVKSIADAAKSTKSKDKTKTGYKGIGFKSVFTDSSVVYIKSNGYFFKFDKTDPVYKDPSKLYGKQLEKLIPTAQKEFWEDYETKKNEYADINNIPWQIKPIWFNITETPTELKNSNFIHPHNVAIALEIGNNIFQEKEYYKKLKNIMEEPRFLLFLRNIKNLVFKYNDENIAITVERNKDHLQVNYNNKLVSSYLKHDYSVVITNKEFTNAGLNLKKQRVNGKDEFTNAEGVPINNIPEKLSTLEESTISFAAKVKDGKIQRLPKKNAILFNYLPTSDKSFEFPFLVNADFVSKTDREFIQSENIWNHYLFFQIGYLHIKWLKDLLKQDQPDILSSYLLALCQKEKNEEDINLGKINTAFNKGFRKAIDEISFIVNDKNKQVTCKEVILDQSGLFAAIGNDAFYQISGATKRLPHHLLDRRVLVKEVLQIEKVSLIQVLNLIKEEEGKEKFQNLIATADDNSYLRFLDWINQTFNETESIKLLKEIVNTYAIFRFKKENDILHLTWDEIRGGEEFILNNNKLSEIDSLLQKIDFIISPFLLDDYVSLNSYLDNSNTYLKSDHTLFTLINKRCLDNKLSVEDKIRLFQFIKNLNQVGEAKYKEELSLFKNRNGEVVPLNLLVKNIPEISEEWLQNFKINKEEGIALDKIGNFTSSQENIFSNIINRESCLEEIKTSITNNNINSLYEGIQKYYSLDVTEDKTNITDKAIIYIDEESRFTNIGEVYYTAFLNNNPHNGNYTSIKNCLNSLTGLILPHKAAINFISIHGFEYKQISITDHLKHSADLETTDVIAFLNFLIQINTEEDLFSKGYFTNTSSALRFNYGTAIQFSAGNSFLNLFIEEQEDHQFHPLPLELTTVTNLAKIGLLEKIHLIKRVITELPFSLKLAEFIKGEGEEVKVEWLSKAHSINFSSDKEYPYQSEEHHLLSIALSIADSHPQVIEVLKENILVDGNSLTKITVDDKVIVKRNDRVYHFSLAKLLPEYEGLSNSITPLIENLSRFTSKRKLESKLFGIRNMEEQEILYELIHNHKELTQPDQLLYLGLTKKDSISNYDRTALTDKDILTRSYETYQEQNPPSSIYILDLLTSISLHDWIYPNDYALDSEKIPENHWLLNWTQTSDSDDRIKFLEAHGLNTINSSIGKIRVFFKEDQIIEVPKISIIEVEKNQSIFLDNTLLYLIQNSSIDINKPEKIKAIGFILTNIQPNKSLPIPVLKDKYENIYELKTIADSTSIVKLDTIPDFYSKKIIDIIVASEGKLHLVDHILPIEWQELFQIEEINTDWIFDSESVKGASILNESPYTDWEHKGKYPIYLIDGKIPRFIIFNGEILDKDKSKHIELYEEKYYFNSYEKHKLAIHLESFLPDEEKVSLWKLYNENSMVNGDMINKAIHDSLVKDKEDLEEKFHRLKKELEELQKKFLAPRDNNDITVSESEDKANMGLESEAQLFGYLKTYYSNEGVVVWANNGGETYNKYDFILKKENGDIIKYIDCKSTYADKKTFYMSKGEWDFFLNNKEKYEIIRVFNTGENGALNEQNILHIDLFEDLLAHKVVPYLEKKELLAASTVFLTVNLKQN